MRFCRWMCCIFEKNLRTIILANLPANLFNSFQICYLFYWLAIDGFLTGPPINNRLRTRTIQWKSPVSVIKKTLRWLQVAFQGDTRNRWRLRGISFKVTWNIVEGYVKQRSRLRGIPLKATSGFQLHRNNFWTGSNIQETRKRNFIRLYNTIIHANKKKI